MMGSKISDVKKMLREQMRLALGEMSEEERNWSDGELLKQFLAHPKVQAAKTILLYYGVGTEVRTAALMAPLLAQGKTICFPRCLPEFQMQAHRVTGELDLHEDRYGIPAPREDCPKVEREDIDLVLVPGLCFDSVGNRLGQGGGYYDRYLEDYEGETLGLCREDFFQINLPREPLDVWIKTILTEEGQVWPYAIEE